MTIYIIKLTFNSGIQIEFANEGKLEWTSVWDSSGKKITHIENFHPFKYEKMSAINFVDWSSVVAIQTIQEIEK